MKFLKKMTLGRRMAIHSIVLVVMASIITLLVILPSIDKAIEVEVKNIPKNIVVSIVSFMDYCDIMTASGIYSVDRAKEEVISYCSNLRYGDNGENYVILIDENLRFVMHPKGPIIGTDLVNLKAHDGTPIGDMIAKAIENKDSAFSSYKWNIDNKTGVKHTYIQRYKNWNWLVASGISDDAVVAASNKITSKIGIMIAVVVMFSLIGSYFMRKTIKNSITSLITYIDRLSDDRDLTAEAEGEIGLSEFIHIKNRLDNLRISFRNAVTDILALSTELATSAEEMEATSENFSTGAQTQASSIEEITSALEEIASGASGSEELTKKQLAKTSNILAKIDEMYALVTQLTGKMSEAEELKIQLDDMIAALMRSAHVSSESVIKLENLMNDITEKADIITNISDSVNLLSLNAAIEAARAGEHGRGFAVVSNEIGKLSEMTQASVKVIRSTIDNVKVNMSMIDSNNKTLMTDLSGSVDKITQFGKIVQDSIGLSRDDMKKQAEVKSNSIEVKAGSENLASAMSEQSIVTEEITKAVSDINGSIQSYAAGAEELSASSSSLAKIAENLVAKVSIFKV